MLDWTAVEVPGENRSNTIYRAQVAETSEAIIRTTLEACVEKAVGLLARNIQDNSLYFLCEWATGKITIVVTDATKTHDAPYSVECNFTGLAAQLAHASAEQLAATRETVKYCLHDYLASCTVFFHYSLVAIFHSSTRNATEIL